MEKQLKLLDIQLKRLRPDFYSSLNEPLNIKELYQWKNGQKDGCYESFVNNSMFLQLEEALDTAQEFTSMIGSDFEIENWIPIFHNGGGDRICYDMIGIFTDQPGQLIEFWHADNDRNVIFPSLNVFIEAINKFYEMKTPADYDQVFEIDNVKEFYKSYCVE